MTGMDMPACIMWSGADIGASDLGGDAAAVLVLDGAMLGLCVAGAHANTNASTSGCTMNVRRDIKLFRLCTIRSGSPSERKRTRSRLAPRHEAEPKTIRSVTTGDKPRRYAASYQPPSVRAWITQSLTQHQCHSSRLQDAPQSPAHTKIVELRLDQARKKAKQKLDASNRVAASSNVPIDLASA